MKTHGLSIRQSILLLTLWSQWPEIAEDGDLMRLSACGYIAPEGPTGTWALTEAGNQRVAEMTGQREVFDPKATQAVIDFLKGVDLKAWAENLPITGDKAADILKLREAIGEYVREGAKVSRSAWGSAPTSADICAVLCRGLADAASSGLVDWSAVYNLFREVEIHGQN